MLDLSSFNNMQLDAIREVGNIGTGNAATALSKLLGRMIDMDVPKAELVSIYELAEHYGDPTELIAAVFVRSLGDFSNSLNRFSLSNFVYTHSFRFTTTNKTRFPSSTTSYSSSY